MIEKFESIITFLIQSVLSDHPFSLQINEFTNSPSLDSIHTARILNSAFLALLCSVSEKDKHKVKTVLHKANQSPEWEVVADFYLDGIDLIIHEIGVIYRQDKDFAARLESLYQWISDHHLKSKSVELSERFWSVFFPEANGLLDDREESINRLREKRTIQISNLKAGPIDEPGHQILFSSNVLLTVPPQATPIKNLPLNNRLKKSLKKIIMEPQIFWYDHPIQIGTVPEKNEVVYGLKGLGSAFEYEKDRGVLAREVKPICLLSVSVTHQGLQDVVREYLEDILTGTSELKNLTVFVFTEADTKRIIQEVIAPAAGHYLNEYDAEKKLAHFGVDGDYGRHYSFLKAVAPFWNILIDSRVKATFKIDLDQIFPQEELVNQTGLSALGHLKTPLWGAEGYDSSGQAVELGMIAGALVNEKDIHESLFMPDVLFPERSLSPDEYIFFSALTQALSTEAEMMTRYDSNRLDGKNRCIQRVHVTGGTNGILVDSLIKHRPFTPSFIGRAEDQAYILSVLFDKEPRLAYVHKEGLFMRHDKEAFAQEAMQRAHVSKLVGDYIRLLYFSAYSGVITEDLRKVKDLLDPFTGCFISRIPLTVVYLRFALKAASFFEQGEDALGLEFIKNGSKRIGKAIDFLSDKRLGAQYQKEKEGWDLYYDCLLEIDKGLRNKDPLAEDLKTRAQEIINRCHIFTFEE